MKAVFILAVMLFSTSVMAVNTWKAVGFMQVASSSFSAVTYLPYVDPQKFATKAICDSHVNDVNTLSPGKSVKGADLVFKLEAVCTSVAGPL